MVDQRALSSPCRCSGCRRNRNSRQNIWQKVKLGKIGQYHNFFMAVFNGFLEGKLVVRPTNVPTQL